MEILILTYLAGSIFFAFVCYAGVIMGIVDELIEEKKIESLNKKVFTVSAIALIIFWPILVPYKMLTKK